MKQALEFTYRNAKGELSTRLVTKWTETQWHFTGFCNNSNTIKTFRKDRIQEYLNNSDQFLNEAVPATSPPIPRNPYKKTTQEPEICFTGFKVDDRKRLEDIARSFKLIVRNSVTEKLSYLCCGYSAGPKKTEKAKEKEITILKGESALFRLLETGELPDD